MMNLVLGFGSPSLPATILQKCSPPPSNHAPPHLGEAPSVTPRRRPSLSGFWVLIGA